MKELGMENKQHIQDFKPYIEKHTSLDLGFKVRKLFEVDVEKIQAWYKDLEENYSDIVGRVDISPGSHLNLGYRTRFCTEKF